MAMKKIFSYGEFDEDGLRDFCADTDYSFTVFSDLHHGYENYNVFRCTEAIARLSKIIEDSKSSKFFISLGDFADNLAGGTALYKELKTHLSTKQIRLYDGKTPLFAGERYLYNVLGNHEVAFTPKRETSHFTPIVEGIGNVFSFVFKDTLFIAYDALFTADKQSDSPQDIRPCTLYTIPNKTISHLKDLLNEGISAGVKSIVAFSHVCLKNIEEHAQEKWLSLLLSYGLPVYIFEGHAHRENYQEFLDDNGGVAKVFTLPAVCDGNTYNRYEVFIRDGKLWRINALEKPFILDC